MKKPLFLALLALCLRLAGPGVTTADYAADIKKYRQALRENPNNTSATK